MSAVYTGVRAYMEATHAAVASSTEIACNHLCTNEKTFQFFKTVSIAYKLSIVMLEGFRL